MTTYSVEDGWVRDNVAILAAGFTANRSLKDDLMQEAFVHLWSIQTRRPAQTWSWYLQSCKFHLRHYLNSGRSIDSLKRHANRVEAGFEQDLGDLDQFAAVDSVFEAVSARDIIEVLSLRLGRREQELLADLAQGLGSREIARRRHLSHTTIIQQRRKIGSILKQIEKPLAGHGPRSARHDPHRGFESALFRDKRLRTGP